ncbi:hypothetical protein A3K64_01645 [Candidatus Micrarchaeota archaeon RBG_16_36_9]|nr:MAG: hypothetical protein A3K64_01645 [Candidatus Micrarchaeota archaeon RBG_16_36_9]
MNLKLSIHNLNKFCYNYRIILLMSNKIIDLNVFNAIIFIKAFSMVNKSEDIVGILYRLRGEINSLFSELKEVYKPKE